MDDSITSSSAGAGLAAFSALFAIIWLTVMAISIGGTVYWVIKIVEVAKLHEVRFRMAGSEKTTWILVVALVGMIGAFIWQFSETRKRVLATPEPLPVPPPWGYGPGPTGAWPPPTGWPPPPGAPTPSGPYGPVPPYGAVPPYGPVGQPGPIEQPGAAGETDPGRWPSTAERPPDADPS